MSRLSPCVLALAGAAIAVVLMTAGRAHADVIEQATVACKAEFWTAKLAHFASEKDMRSYRRLADAKTKVGDCMPIRAHTEVKIEKYANDLACVKEKGDKRCLWVLETTLRITSERHEPVRRNYMACKSPLYLDTWRKILAKHDLTAMKRFRVATGESGECQGLRRGERVDVEKREDKMLCVRRPGQFQCYWTDGAALPPKI